MHMFVVWIWTGYSFFFHLKKVLLKYSRFWNGCSYGKYVIDGNLITWAIYGAHLPYNMTELHYWECYSSWLLSLKWFWYKISFWSLTLMAFFWPISDGGIWQFLLLLYQWVHSSRNETFLVMELWRNSFCPYLWKESNWVSWLK